MSFLSCRSPPIIPSLGLLLEKAIEKKNNTNKNNNNNDNNNDDDDDDRARFIGAEHLESVCFIFYFLIIYHFSDFAILFQI